MFAVDTKTNEIFLYDDIGPAWLGMIDATSVIAGLKQMEGKRVLLRINSPGGSVDEGRQSTTQSNGIRAGSMLPSMV